MTWDYANKRQKYKIINLGTTLLDVFLKTQKISFN